MSYTAWKTFGFVAAHHSSGVRLHTHSYKVTVELVSASLVIPGSVIGTDDLDPVKGWLETVFDRKDLSESLGPWWEMVGLDYGTVPTAEHLAELIFYVIRDARIPGLPLGVTSSVAAVKVQETETSSAEFRP